MNENQMHDEMNKETEARINALRQALKNTDYQAIKAAEGYIPATEFAEIRTQRQAWRNELTELEEKVTLEESKKVKLAELGMACEAAIFAGVNVTTSQGEEHFSLTINDQTNIGNLAMQAQGGATVLYHSDGNLCRAFTPEEIGAVAAAAVKHKTIHTTLCNHLNAWVRRSESTEEIAAIQYGGPLPADLDASYNALLGAEA